MRLHRVAAVLLLIIFVLVGVHAAVTVHALDRTLATVDALPTPEGEGARDAFEALREDCDALERLLHLTVSHDDLSSVRTSLADLDGAILARDEVAFLQAKSRLQDALWHLRRLSVPGLYSIF